jgi:proteasome assembly chaperone (PAC2) family protein
MARPGRPEPDASGRAQRKEKETWLVAAWPGMGAVAILAAETLVNALHAERIAEQTFDAWFDVGRVTVDEGVLTPAPRPRGFLFSWKNPVPAGRDLLIFLAEAQPESRQWEYCDAVLDFVRPHGVSRVVTFAAMASPSEPADAARVFAAGTSRHVVQPLPKDVVRMTDGEIGGLNGILVAAAAARGLDGLCLLGEFPFFATQVPNPKAAAAVLRTFSRLVDVPLDVRPLDLQARKVQRRLEQLLRQMRDEQARNAEAREAAQEDETEDVETDGDAPETGPEPSHRLADADRRRIEQMFEQAAADRTKALALKAELDRLGAFKEFEDRFLDLFRRAE